MALVTLTPVDPRGKPLTVELTDRVQVSGGVGGWETSDRPRLTQVMEWAGTPLRTLAVPIGLSGMADAPGERDTDVETTMTQVEALGRPTKATGQPPVLTVAGPFRHLGLRYVVVALEWDEDTYIAGAHGKRLQQFGILTLQQYVAADVLVTPTKKARKKTKKGKRARTVTVRAGDTLAKIAARELHAAKRWKEIATLNGIRDGDSLRAGRVLKLPS